MEMSPYPQSVLEKLVGSLTVSSIELLPPSPLFAARPLGADAKVRQQHYVNREHWLGVFDRSGLCVLEEVAGAALTAECNARDRADLENIKTRAAQ